MATEPGLPGGPPVGRITIRKQITYNELMLLDVQPLPDGARQVTLVEADGTAHLIPFSAEGAERLGRQLLAPRVAVVQQGKPNGLHAL